MLDSLPDLASEYEALVQFLYVAPVGMVQTASDGEILMMNPVSARFMMPLSRDGSLVNLFSILEAVLPDLRQRAAQLNGSHGMVCDGVPIEVPAGALGRGDPKFLSLTLLKLDEKRLMAVLQDVSDQVRRDRVHQQREVWVDALLNGASEDSSIALDDDGLVGGWNIGIDQHGAQTPCDDGGIASRHAFYRAAEREMGRWRRAQRPLSVVLFGADRFEQINDDHGHPAGDAVLGDFGGVLARTFRPVDTVARIGGDAFAVLMPSTGIDGAVSAANRLCEAVAERIVAVDDRRVRYTVSGGVATMDAGVASVDALMRRADLSLSAARAAGHNRVESGAGVPAIAS